MFTDVEPFYGWLAFYSHETDSNSPFHEVEHNLFEYDRYIYTYAAHPCWDTIESESLLVKILFADYHQGYAIIELLGEWNDLYENDFKLLCENCLTYLVDNQIYKIILICENVFNAYLQEDDYYAAFTEELGDDGWLCLFKARPGVLEEFIKYNISSYVYWNHELDQIHWRKLKPWQLYQLIEQAYRRSLPRLQA